MLGLSWQETEQRRLQQLHESRKQRFLQVRAQAKEQSHQRLHSYKTRVSELTETKLGLLQQDWESEREQRLHDLQAACTKSLKQVGSGHGTAAEVLQERLAANRQQADRLAQRTRAAAERFSSAVAAERELQHKEEAPRREMLQRRAHVQDMEAERSAAAVAENNRRAQQMEQERASAAQQESELLAKGFPSNIDFKYSRLHELGMPRVVERHSHAGADGLGKSMFQAVEDENTRAWEEEKGRIASRASAAEQEEKRLAIASLRKQMEENKRSMEAELERMRREKLKEAAKTTSQGVAMSNLQRDAEQHRRQALAERFFEQRIAPGLAGATDQQVRAAVPEEHPRASGWPTDEGWQPPDGNDATPGGPEVGETLAGKENPVGVSFQAWHRPARSAFAGGAQEKEATTGRPRKPRPPPAPRPAKEARPAQPRVPDGGPQRARAPVSASGASRCRAKPTAAQSGSQTRPAPAQGRSQRARPETARAPTQRTSVPRPWRSAKPDQPQRQGKPAVQPKKQAAAPRARAPDEPRGAPTRPDTSQALQKSERSSDRGTAAGAAPSSSTLAGVSSSLSSLLAAVGEVEGSSGSLEELQALQRELGLPVSATVPGRNGSQLSGESSDISGITAVLEKYRREIRSAADKTASALAAAQRSRGRAEGAATGSAQPRAPEPRSALPRPSAAPPEPSKHSAPGRIAVQPSSGAGVGSALQHGPASRGAENLTRGLEGALKREQSVEEQQGSKPLERQLLSDLSGAVSAHDGAFLPAGRAGRSEAGEQGGAVAPAEWDSEGSGAGGAVRAELGSSSGAGGDVSMSFNDVAVVPTASSGLSGISSLLNRSGRSEQSADPVAELGPEPQHGRRESGQDAEGKGATFAAWVPPETPAPGDQQRQAGSSNRSSSNLSGLSTILAELKDTVPPLPGQADPLMATSLGSGSESAAASSYGGPSDVSFGEAGSEASSGLTGITLLLGENTQSSRPAAVPPLRWVPRAGSASTAVSSAPAAGSEASPRGTDLTYRTSSDITGISVLLGEGSRPALEGASIPAEEQRPAPVQSPPGAPPGAVGAAAPPPQGDGNPAMAGNLVAVGGAAGEPPWGQLPVRASAAAPPDSGGRASPGPGSARREQGLSPTPGAFNRLRAYLAFEGGRTGLYPAAGDTLASGPEGAGVEAPEAAASEEAGALVGIPGRGGAQEPPRAPGGEQAGGQDTAPPARSGAAGPAEALATRIASEHARQMATIWSRAISEHDSDVSVLNASGHHPMGESSPDTPRSPRTPRARGAPRSEVPSPRQWWPGRGQVSARSSPRSAGSNQTDGGFSPPPPSVASSALQQEWRASILEDLRTAEGAAASSSMVNAVLRDEGPLQANDHAPRSDPSADEADQHPHGAPSAGDQGRAERWAAP